MPGAAIDFDTLYEEHFAFVWRAVRQLGVLPASLDDAVQDVFIVAHRRLADYEPRATLRSWLAGIAYRVASDYRRSARRKGGGVELSPELPSSRPSPHDDAETSESMRLFFRALDALDARQREVFVLVEVEQFTAPEAAAALGIPVNTVYSRLRSARLAFDGFLEAGGGSERELGERGRGLVSEARGALRPTAEDRARLRAALAARLGPTPGPTAPRGGASAPALGSVPLGVKIGGGLAAIALLAGSLLPVRSGARDVAAPALGSSQRSRHRRPSRRRRLAPSWRGAAAASTVADPASA